MLVKQATTTKRYIMIHPSPTADTRTCDVSKVTKEQLLESSKSHIQDVGKGLNFFQDMLEHAASRHDLDKITEINHFHSDFITKFEKTGWWDEHRLINRHHLKESDGVRDDVNLIDVIEYITDCVMAGMARSGKVYDVEIKDNVLKKAFKNTVELLKSKVKVEKK